VPVPAVPAVPVLMVVFVDVVLSVFFGAIGMANERVSQDPPACYFQDVEDAYAGPCYSTLGNTCHYDSPQNRYRRAH
jgi:hypothetical protein